MLERYKEKVRQELVHAMSRMNDQVSPALFPEGGIRLVYAIQGARSPDDVGCCLIGASGSVDVKPIPISFGVTTCRTVSAILTALRFSPEIRSAADIRYTEDLVSVCADMLLEICECDPGKIPPGVSTMDWAVAFCSEEKEGVPDVICIKNGETFPGQARIFGENPVMVATNLIKISQRISDATHRER